MPDDTTPGPDDTPPGGVRAPGLSEASGSAAVGRSPDRPGPWELPEPALRWENRQPVSVDFDDVYFSRDSGLAEVEHVFIAGNDLEARFRALPEDRPGTFCIGETGFGTGLNLLATWRLWQRCSPPGWRLHWLSTELYPLRQSQLRQALDAWPQLADAAEALLAIYPPRLPGYHWRWLEPGQVSLGLWYGDAAAGLEALLDSGAAEMSDVGPRVDAWVLDGFAPARNPAMWQDRLYRQLRAWSRPGTSFATFTAAGHVRRGLQAQGFEVEKCAGFGRKRDMVRGRWIGFPPAPATGRDADGSTNPTAPAASVPVVTPVPESSPTRGPSPAPSPADYWATALLPRPARRSAVVVGAGLAGSATALALARRGWRVQVLERADRLGAGASGNAQGVLYTRFSAQPDPLSQFALRSYLYALRHYRQLVASHKLTADDHDFCGVLQLPANASQARRQREAIAALGNHPDLVQALDRSDAEQRAGVPLPQGGLWLPDAGWLSPVAVCRAQLDHPAVELRLGSAATALERQGDGWRVQLVDGDHLDSALVVVCSGAASQWLSPWMSIPTRAIRGQVSHVAAPARLPDCVLCHEGYVTAAPRSGLWIGATFDPDDRDPDVRAADHQRNLDSLHTAIPGLVGSDSIVDTGRVGFRAASPDYLPLAGPVAAQPAFDHTYAALRDNARRPVAMPPPLLPGLLLNVGHGSRGLTSTPLCAELIAALAGGEPRPCERAMMQTITPVRFDARAFTKRRKPHGREVRS